MSSRETCLPVIFSGTRGELKFLRDKEMIMMSSAGHCCSYNLTAGSYLDCPPTPGCRPPPPRPPPPPTTSRSQRRRPTRAWTPWKSQIRTSRLRRERNCLVLMRCRYRESTGPATDTAVQDGRLLIQSITALRVRDFSQNYLQTKLALALALCCLRFARAELVNLTRSKCLTIIITQHRTDVQSGRIFPRYFTKCWFDLNCSARPHVQIFLSWMS